MHTQRLQKAPLLREAPHEPQQLECKQLAAVPSASVLTSQAWLLSYHFLKVHPKVLLAVTVCEISVPEASVSILRSLMPEYGTGNYLQFHANGIRRLRLARPGFDMHDDFFTPLDLPAPIRRFLPELVE